MSGGGQTYLPLRVNMAGVIPVIFAASVMAIPPTVGQLLAKNATHGFSHGLAVFFNPGGWHYVAGESIFILSISRRASTAALSGRLASSIFFAISVDSRSPGSPSPSSV